MFSYFFSSSWTIFTSHNKKSIKKYLFTNTVKSILSLQLSRDFDVQYKTAWVQSHKTGESLMLNKVDSKLSGVC